MSTFSLVGEPERILYRSDAFQAKLFAALGIIGTALKRSRRPYIAFSGGIDSTAVMVLCEMVRPGIPVCWSDDELEVPETVAYMTFMQRVAGPQFQAFTGGATHAGWFTPWSAVYAVLITQTRGALFAVARCSGGTYAPTPGDTKIPRAAGTGRST